MASLTQLEYVLAVEKHRHFGKAAVACHISQPTLSQQIQKLEDELNIVIFDRLQKPVLPTPEGQRFLDQAKVVLRENERLLHLARTTGSEGVSGDFRLGVIPTVACDLIPLFVDQFSRSFPKVELYVEEMKTESILEALGSDQIDAGILATPLPSQGFKVHPLYYETFVLYLSEGHPNLAKQRLSTSDLELDEMWMLTDGHCFKDQVLNFCSFTTREKAVLPNVHFQSGSLDTLRNLVKGSRGYTLLPALMTRRMTAAEIAKHVREFRKPYPTREISVIYRRDHWKLDIIDAIEKTIWSTLPPLVSRDRRPDQKILEIS